MPKIIEDIVIRNQDEKENVQKNTVRQSDDSNLYERNLNQINDDTPYAKAKEERDREHLDEPLYKTSRPKYKPLREETHGKKNGVWYFAVIAIIALFVGLGTILSEAKIVVHPKIAEITSSNENYSATLNKSSDGTIGYQLVSVSDKITENVEFTNSEEKEIKATGKIIIYNEYSSAPQKLIATTRFSAPDGLIYMIDSPVTVPGTTTKNGVITPGSIEVAVTAEKPGATYNKEPTDFTIPGFKGTSKYTKFYARSNGPISGGTTGLVYSLSEEESASLKSKMSEELNTRLKERIHNETPSELVIFDTTLVFVTDEVSGKIESSQKEQEVTLSATMSAYALSKDDLAKQMANRNSVLADSISNEGVSIEDFSNLSLTPSTVLTDIAPETWTFTLTGSVKIVSNINSNEIAKALAGKNRKEAKIKLADFPYIEKADVILSPFWKSKLPTNSESIVVESKT